MRGKKATLASPMSAPAPPVQGVGGCSSQPTHRKTHSTPPKAVAEEAKQPSPSPSPSSPRGPPQHRKTRSVPSTPLRAHARPYVPLHSPTRPARLDVDDDLEADAALAGPCVWVGNLCKTVSEEELTQTFEAFGVVSSLSVFRGSQCAFVTFEDAVSAVEARRALDGTVLGTLPLSLNVGRASRHLWVGNIDPESVEIDDLSRAFGAFGTVLSVRVLQRSRCAFVNFEREEAACDALRHMNGALLRGNELAVNFKWNKTPRGPSPARMRLSPSASSSTLVSTTTTATSTSTASGQHRSRMPPRPHQTAPHHLPHRHHQQHRQGTATQYVPSRQLFVGGVDASVTDEQLSLLFGGFGPLETIKRLPARMFVFVVYVSLRDAMQARMMLSTYPPVLNNRVLTVNFGKQPSQPSQQQGDAISLGRLVVSLSHDSFSSTPRSASPSSVHSARTTPTGRGRPPRHPRFAGGLRARSLDVDDMMERNLAYRTTDDEIEAVDEADDEASDGTPAPHAADCASAAVAAAAAAAAADDDDDCGE